MDRQTLESTLNSRQATEWRRPQRRNAEARRRASRVVKRKPLSFATACLPKETAILNERTLTPGNLDACEDPFTLFSRWFEDARTHEVNDPEAMSLATVDDEGLPDVRMVLCKGVEPEGLVFYTNAESAKGRQVERHPKAAALFHWKSLRRQARFRGEVRLIDEAAADGTPYATCLALAESAQSVRGYGPIKETAVAAWRSRVAALRAG